MKGPRIAPMLGPYKPVIEQLVAENERLPRKHRYTGRRISELLQAQGYVGRRASGARSIRASARISLEADAQGCFRRRICTPQLGRTALFRAWVPGDVEFLRLHRGGSERTLRKTRLVLGEFAECCEGQGRRA